MAKTGYEEEQTRFRITLNFSKEEFEIFQEAGKVLDMSPAKLIKQSLLQESVTNFLKLLVTNADNLRQIAYTIDKGKEAIAKEQREQERELNRAKYSKKKKKD
jgi:hypothetical protein